MPFCNRDFSMNPVHTLILTAESCWDWCAKTDATQLMLQASLFVFVVEVVRRWGRWKWPKVAYDSCFANILLMLINGALAPVFVILVDLAEASYGELGIPRLQTQTWDTVPVWASILVILLASDFCDYWNHRLMHVLRWLWPIHAIHHSDEHPTVLTSGRVHLLEPLIMQMSYLLLLTWMNLPYEVLGGVAGLRVLHNMYVHMHLDWDHGPLKYVIASPRYHRWHHADDPEIYGKNLANLFPFYDVLFGTYYVPGRCDAEMGAKGVPTDAMTLVAWPFVAWTKMIKRRYRRWRKRQDAVRTQQAG